MPVGPKPGQPIKPSFPIVVRPDQPWKPGDPVPPPPPTPKVGFPYPPTEMARLAKQSYKTEADRINPYNGFSILAQSETMIIYQDDTIPNNHVVAIRGTKTGEAEDLGADAFIHWDILGSTNRYNKDYNFLKDFQSAHPGGVYYGTSHSLGGAIMDNLINSGLLTSGISFNPAIQLKDIIMPKNVRIFQHFDPLYTYRGFLDPKAERLPPIEGHTALDALYYHKLDRFIPELAGGARGEAERLTDWLERFLEHNRVPEARESEYLHEHIDVIVPMLKAHWKRKGWPADDLIHEMIQFGNHGSTLFEPYVHPISPPAGGRAIKIPKKLQKIYLSQKKEVMNIAMPDWVRDHMPKKPRRRGGAQTATQTSNLEAQKAEAIRTLQGLQSFADSNGQGADNRAALEKLQSVNASDACEPANIQKIKDGQAQVDSTISKNKTGLMFYPSKKKDLEHVKAVLGQMLAECQKSGAGRRKMRGGFPPYNRTTPATNCKTSEWNCVRTSGRYYGSDFDGVACYDTDPKYCKDDRRFPDGPPYEMYA